MNYKSYCCVMREKLGTKTLRSLALAANWIKLNSHPIKVFFGGGDSFLSCAIVWNSLAVWPRCRGFSCCARFTKHNMFRLAFNCRLFFP